MSQVAYKDFGWQSNSAANGQVGVRLAETVVREVSRLENVQRICDLGCGNGYLAGRLVAKGFEVTGVDASATGIALARTNYSSAHFFRAEISARVAQEIGDDDFDLVISSDVIEHLYRPSDLLEAAYTLLRPRGQILITTPYHGYLKNLALSITGKWDTHFTSLQDGGHIKFFSVRTLSALVTSHGFTDLTFKYYGRAPWLWMNMICHARKF